MIQIATRADTRAVEAEMPLAERLGAASAYQALQNTAAKYPDRPAITFQIRSGPKDRAETLHWAALQARVTQAANLFRSLGVTETDTVAYILPNCLEAPVTLLGGATAGIVCPVNPLLPADQIGAILRDTRAKVVVTLAPFPKTDVAQKVAEAVALAPGVETVLQVDLKRYLSPPLSWIVPVIRPKLTPRHRARVADFATELARQADDRLTFEETLDDRVCSYFHTGGTTGLPKIAQHRASGMLYNGWCGAYYMFTHEDVLICPLPMFHVFAAYPVLFSCLMSGGHMVMPTPQGYRGAGVFDNFWKLIERYRVTFLITVPTAAAALMQRKVDADVSSLRLGVSGSAPMPIDLFRRFEEATGIRILEGYGMTEATCLISVNPPYGERKIGTVGLPFPYTDVRILHCEADGTVIRECDPDEVGEICVKGPGISGGAVYTDPDRNRGLFADGYMRTGDLGAMDRDGYITITGRAKDLIIRGGHNIDPGVIEDAMATHDAVAFAGAVGQPDAHAGEVPAVYVELVAGAAVDAAALMEHARQTIGERAAIPRHVEILAELPKTAVGKVFKPALRQMAIARVYGAALAEAGLSVRVAAVEEDPKRGLVAILDPGDGSADSGQVVGVLGSFTVPWRWREPETDRAA